MRNRITAITIGGNANTIGMAIGLFLPTIFIRVPDEKPEEVKDQLFIS